MGRAKSYREPERPGAPRPRGVTVSRAEPPPDPDAADAKARRDAGKLLAEDIAAQARGAREEQDRVRVVGWVVEALLALFRL